MLASNPTNYRNRSPNDRKEVSASGMGRKKGPREVLKNRIVDSIPDTFSYPTEDEAVELFEAEKHAMRRQRTAADR